MGLEQEQSGFSTLVEERAQRIMGDTASSKYIKEELDWMSASMKEKYSLEEVVKLYATMSELIKGDYGIEVEVFERFPVLLVKQILEKKRVPDLYTRY